jgi:hypothetical protein
VIEFEWVVHKAKEKNKAAREDTEDYTVEVSFNLGIYYFTQVIVSGGVTNGIW